MTKTEAIKEPAYVIASLNHTRKDQEHITFWAADQRGYVIAFDARLGLYLGDEARRLHTVYSSCLAVPEDAARALLSPTPYFALNGKAVQFYDCAGPVVDNTAANWAKLRAAALQHDWAKKEKPGVFTRRRASFALPGAAIA